MIKKLRRKFVLVVMVVVTAILLATFLTILVSTQRNNERRSISLLHQTLNMRPFPNTMKPPFVDGPPFPEEAFDPRMRLPVLVVELNGEGSIRSISNQLHFIEDEDIAPIVELARTKKENIGVLRSYELRYLRELSENGMRIAFADISMEQALLKMQITNSLIIGGLAMLAFFSLSLPLARWAVRPVEIAWEQQKQFIANASHELKTPLTVILSNAEMLKTKGIFVDERNARRLEHIYVEAVRMKQLVEDMLTLARSDSEVNLGNRGVVDFSYLVKSALLMYEPIAYDEEKNLTFEIEEGLAVLGDSVQLQQLAHILLDNACKYCSPRGKIDVSLRKAEQKSLLLVISNEGSPIPKRELKHIFTRFYRRDESRSEHGSFGLGLSIAQSIVNGHNGTIWAESEESRGNHFFVSLPLEQTLSSHA